MYLAWNLTERERLTLYYDSVEELGGGGGRGLAGFQWLFSPLIGGQSRIKCVACTLA